MMVFDALFKDLQLVSHDWVDLVWMMISALVCGFLLGFERQRKSKPVGILTAVLVTVGSALFAKTGLLLTAGAGLPGDATRLASMIASGIGFIGAGAILRSQYNVTGLASAATIWGLGALGILIGTGHGLVALLAAGVFWMLLRAVPELEHFLFRGKFCLHATVVVERGRVSEVCAFLWENQITGFSTNPLDEERAEIRLDECGLESRGGIVNVLRGLGGVEEVVDRRKVARGK